MTEEKVPVLIVGAGAAGLSLSLLLQQQGVASLLIERREDISIYPRARNLNFRTMEIFRGLGLAAEVHAAGSHVSQMVLKETLASKNQELVDPTANIKLSESLTPEPFFWYCPQNRLEPILRTAAQERGADVRYGASLVSFTQDEAGVTATVEERASGRTYMVRADYLAACDGAKSPIREELGIETTGLGVLPEYFIFVYFRAPWQELVAGHEADAFVIKNAKAEGMFLVAKGDLGMFMITYRPSAGDSLDDFTPERCRQLILDAIGKPDMPVEVVEIAHWQSAERVATQFQQGRVFLVGDSAHTMPAYKGLGANTAIQSAQNLAWKLAAVIGQRATSDLLKTYEEERLPVGRFAAHQSLTGPAAAWLPRDTFGTHLGEEEELPIFYPIVGYRYRSQAIVQEDAASAELGEIVLLDREELTGTPGTRVPHVWLDCDSWHISTLDLLDGRFVLLCGSKGAAWYKAACSVGASFGGKLAAYRIGPGGDMVGAGQHWSERMGVSTKGAVLIRPDGFVAWRHAQASPYSEIVLNRALRRIHCRSMAISAKASTASRR